MNPNSPAVSLPLESFGMGRDHQSQLFVAGSEVFRAIYPRYASFFERLLAEPAVVQAIEQRMLIPAERSARQIEGFGLIIRHPRLRFVTYPFEWTPSMFKAAVLCILRLNLRLMERGLCLMDAHPWNVCFDGTTPVFVDFSSIIELPPEGRWEQARAFELNCIQPLEIMAKGYPALARMLLRNAIEPFDEIITPALLAHPERRGSGLGGKIRAVIDFVGPRIARRLDRRVRQGDRSATLGELRKWERWIAGLNVVPPGGKWAAYYAGRDEVQQYPATREEFLAAREATPKPAIVDDLLGKLAPASVLDIGCNRGLDSQLAALRGAQVVGLDMDESVLDQMYRDSVAIGSGAIPLVANPVVPVEATGPASRPLPKLAERLCADCVLALAVVHHIVFGPAAMNFDEVAKLLASCTRDAVIVEFVPREDSVVAAWFEKRSADFVSRFEFYTLENFRAALEREFATVVLHPSHPATRTILLCRKAARAGA